MKIIETEMNQEIFERIKSETKEQRALFMYEPDASFLRDEGFDVRGLVPKYFKYPKLYINPETCSYVFEIPNNPLNYNDRLFRSLVFYKNMLYVFIIPFGGGSLDVDGRGPESLIYSYQKNVPDELRDEILLFLQSYYRIVGSRGIGWKEDDWFSQYVPVEIKLTNNWWGE